MSVMMWMVAEGESIPGGHQVQFHKTIDGLRALGLEIVSNDDNPEPDLGGVDLIHGFGMDRFEIRRAREQGVPVVLSTIYWEQAYTAGVLDAPRRLRLERAVRLARSYAVRGPVSTANRVLEPSMAKALAYESAALLLPNSQSEGRMIAKDLRVSTPFHVVPNAVDHAFYSVGRTDEPSGIDVLCVGRIEPHKNQLQLIKALNGSGLSLALAGSAHPHHQPYYDECVATAGPNVRFLGHVVGPPLRSLYRAARVHALPSRYETTGLSSLEAALCGCSVVTTDRGFTRDYMQNLAYYCDPTNRASILRAVQSALARPLSGLRERVLANYTWAHTADATLAGYKRVLGSSATDLSRRRA